jgi:hypothetical protein
MLETYELLDRFEILYPEVTEFSDLRRAYNDEDLSSIFRLVTDATKEDIRKLVMEDNTWSLWKLLAEYKDTQFVAAFKNFFVNNTEYDNDCFSRGQLQSKLWLVNELKKLDVDLGTVFLCAGWYGTLATMLFESSIKVDKIRSFDIDESTVSIAEVFNKPWFTDQWRYKALVQDIMDIDYTEHKWQFWSNANNRMSRPITDIPNTIINTSCEHIGNFTEWYNKIPDGKLVILQSNDFFEVKEHVNCAVDAEDFSRMTPMSECLFLGELPLEKYTRFMKIGYK